MLGKKRYAGLKIQNSISNNSYKVIKGLEMIKRDQCSIVKDVGNQILDQILSGQNRVSVVQNIRNIISKVSKEIYSYHYSQFQISKVFIFFIVTTLLI